MNNSTSSVKCYYDTRILNDTRLLTNLNNIQNYYIDNKNYKSYFQTIQKDLKAYMRKVVVSWMLDVCEEEKCDTLVFPLAAYILDRFLCVYPIKCHMFQCIACVCLFLSSKIYNVIPFDANKLVLFSDNSITIQNLIDGETLVLSILKWDIISITPIEYVDYLISHLFNKFDFFDNINDIEDEYLNDDSIDSINERTVDIEKLKNHCKTLIFLCIFELECTSNSPSLISAACLVCALHGLHKHVNLQYLLETVSCLAGVNLDDLVKFKDFIDQLYANSVNKLDDDS